MSAWIYLFSWSGVSGQLAVSNLGEYQLGNLPYTDPRNLTTLYDQLNVDYYYQNLLLGLRLETFRASELDHRFVEISQKYLEGQTDHLRLRIGNYYAMLGRGVVLRAFELPGIIFEDKVYRRRYSLSRDLEGIIMKGTWPRIEFTLLRGEPLDSALPPGVENLKRRQGLVEGGELRLRPWGWLMIGGTYLRTNRPDDQQQEVASALWQGSFQPLTEKFDLRDVTLDFYGEYAQVQGKLGTFLSLDSEQAHALYLSANILYRSFGLSVEYKDYQSFDLGINDPPYLVKEHNLTLLNRSTHILLPQNERGYQIEGTCGWSGYATFAFNLSHAVNDLPHRETEFEERYGEVTVNFGPNLSAMFFYDRGKDGSIFHKSRDSWGTTADWQMGHSYGFQLDLESQKVTRSFVPGQEEDFSNHFLSLSFLRSPRVALAVIGERSTDPFETDNPETFDKVEKGPKYWLGVNLNYQISVEHELNIFYGHRRGGPACTAGTCYEVLPFEGLELRLSSRF
ncbi:MAG: DUF6029 family protein [bacterium]